MFFLDRISRRSLATQVLVASLATSVLVMAVTAGVVAWRSLAASEREIQREMSAVLTLVQESLMLSYNAAVERAQVLAPLMQNEYGGLPIPDGSSTRSGNVELPTLTAEGKVVNNDSKPLETIRRYTGADSSVLVRHNGEWLRAATLLKDANGISMAGTALPHDEFLANTLTKGEEGAGLMERDGRFYAAYAQPLSGMDGSTYGGFAVIIDVSREVSDVLASVARSTVAGHGKMWVIAPTADGKGRRFLVHPQHKGKSVDAVMSGPDLALLQSLAGEGKRGVMDVTLGGEPQIMSYLNVPGWGWTVIAVGPEKAFLSDSYQDIALMIGVMLLGGLLTGALIYWRTASTLRPVREVVAGITRLGDGDLRVDVPAGPAKSSNEIHIMADRINATRARIALLAQQMGATGSQVAAASTQTLDALAQIGRSTEVQSDAASGVAAAVEQLTVSISQIADSSRDANTFSQASSGAANEGAAVVRTTVSGIETLAGRVTASADVVQELETSSREISEVIKTIQEIAEQTNLLALNAAIEAARAGEGGRGFSVVADEVRRLAERTKVSTTQIAQVISGVQTKTSQAADAMRAVNIDMQASAESARQAGDVLQRIREAAARTAAVVADISNAAAEQKSASEQIASRVEQIAQHTEESAAAVQQSVAAGESLQDQARELDSTIRTLRT
ncbi:methyl-accepting chemotaxis protein [Pigmentiphaga aceris]|uniref:Methyl-accepting chemotaxis protein n=1 Tax=Pigmentiphaga aceris TaxID=1940612 RepID=A0A5C0B319_9BURK|nr:methyl-accepting chemotaxis protein [Pigmentiphaga aceris]QEI07151.1 methyl-accepting chemotaxis protein [Pigmentiphaga aceris]